MGYEYITKYNFPGHTPGAAVAATFRAGPRTVEADVIHWWGLPEWKPTFNGTCQHFMNQTAAGTGAHYVVEAGKVACGIREADASHANGNAWANAHTVTWECNPLCRDGDYDTLAEALADCWIARGYRKPGKITGHNQYTATMCPGHYDLNRIRREAAAWFYAKKNGTAANGPALKPAQDNKQKLEWSDMASEKEVENAGYRGAKRAIRELLGDVVDVPGNQATGKGNDQWTLVNALTNIWAAANTAAHNSDPDRIAKAVLTHPIELQGIHEGTTDLATKAGWEAHELQRIRQAIEALAAPEDPYTGGK